jgi:antitoxin component of MazEF toxin-antitoxin module
MVKTLTSVGNSKALIIPAELIKKYGLETVVIEETPEGLLIKSATQESDFQLKLDRLKKYKNEVYSKLEEEVRDPEVKDYYSDPNNDFSNADPDIL